ncbi:MAG: cytochrome c-type biogenesis protein CcmH [Bacteroidota bacterium]
MKALALLMALGTAVAAPAVQAADRVQDLFQRLFSPCCYRETIDMHASPQADDLRLEVRDRVSRGETTEAILAHMVSRYGPDVLTRPPGRGLSVALFTGAGVFTSALLLFAARRSRRAVAPAPDSQRRQVPAEPEHELLDMLNNEIAALD